jgi:hypothetical protein
METPLNRKVLWEFTKMTVPYPKANEYKFIIDGKKDTVVGYIMSYVSKNIFFCTRRINYLNHFFKKRKFLFNNTDESLVMKIEQ